MVAPLMVLAATTPTVILDESFDAFTEGSEETPGTTDISVGYSGKLRTTLSGWTGKSIYEAGGKLKIADGGYLQTARYNMSANSGVVKITARVKMLASTGGILKVSLGYTTVGQVAVYDNKWTDVSVIAAGGTSSSYVRVEPYLVFEGLLIDNLKIETSPDMFPAPEAYQPTQADGTSFTAKWSRVKGATSYLLDVYTGQGDAKTYVMQAQKLTLTPQKVTGLDASKTYRYTVRATNGTAVSEPSNEIEVIKVIRSLDAPVAKAATDVTDDSFTANWEPVADAQSYQVNVYRQSTTKQAGDLDLIDEDFSGVTKGTFSKVEYGSLEEYLDAYTKTTGWWAKQHVFAAGTIGLSPFSGAASLTTPQLDLTADGGKVKVSVTMAAMNYAPEAVADTAFVNLVDQNDSVIAQQMVLLQAEMKEYVVNFTQGAANQAISIAYNGSNRLFIDAVKVSQNVPAGYVKTDHVLTIEGLTGTSCAVEAPILNGDGDVYLYDVQAVAPTVDYTGDVTTITSDKSNRIVVPAKQTGISDVNASKQAVRVQYFDLMGREHTTAVSGINVVVTTWTDGTRTSQKVMK